MSDPEKPDVPIPPPPPVPPGMQPKAPAAGAAPGTTPGAQPSAPSTGAGEQPAGAPPPLQQQWTYDKSELPQNSGAFNTMAVILVVLCFMGMVFVLGSSKGLIKTSGFGAENTAKVAAEMVQMRDPLPADWQWGMSTDVLGVKIAEVDYKPNNQLKASVEFISMPNRQKLSADQMPSQPEYLNRGLTTEGATFQQDATGSATIAAKKIFFARGTRALPTKGKSAVEVGFVPLSGDKVLTIQSTEYGTPTFDQTMVQPLWDAVAAIKE
ncbi:MAG TPA: hypothetical protein V6D22_01280 [Candidatus Obscuribacterales bacterium]